MKRFEPLITRIGANGKSTTGDYADGRGCSEPWKMWAQCPHRASKLWKKQAGRMLYVSNLWKKTAQKFQTLEIRPPTFPMRGTFWLHFSNVWKNAIQTTDFEMR